jgi:hypothetical protein
VFPFLERFGLFVSQLGDVLRVDFFGDRCELVQPLEIDAFFLLSDVD